MRRCAADAGAPPGQAQVRTDGHEDGSDQEAAEAAARPPPVVSIRGLTKSYGYTQVDPNFSCLSKPVPTQARIPGCGTCQVF